MSDRCYLVCLMLQPNQPNVFLANPLKNERTMPMKHCDRIYCNPDQTEYYIYKIFSDYDTAWKNHKKQIDLFDDAFIHPRKHRDWLVVGGLGDVYTFKNRKAAFRFIKRDIKQTAYAASKYKRLK